MFFHPRTFGGRLLVLLWTIGLVGCIDPVSPDLDDPPRRLVVDGLVTSGPGPHTVRLTYSAAFEQSLRGLTTAVKGATVTIEDDAGESARLTEQGPGIYRTAPEALDGQPGRSYTLSVTLPDGTTYHSTPERMHPVPPVDTVFAELVEKPSMQFGFQIYAETSDPASTMNYYRWRWSGVYERVVAFNLVTFPCWVNDSPVLRNTASLSLAKDTFTNGRRIARQPVAFLPLDFKLVYGYSFAVEQLSLSPAAYEFWHQIQQQLEQSGSIFDPPPDRIRSNVRNVDNPQDVALGYFGASAVARKRICIDLRDYPDRPPVQLPPPPIGPTCNVIHGQGTPPDFWTCTTSTPAP